MVAFKVYGTVHDLNTFYCESLTKKIADKLGDGSTVQLIAVVEIDYWLKIDQLIKDEGFSTLIHHTRTNLILRDREVIGDIDALLKIAVEQYGVEDAEVSNTVVFNRMVRETSFEAFKVFKNPLMSIQFVVSGGPRESSTEDLGAIIVEL